MVSNVAKLLKGRSQDKRRRIEAAALALFTTQGFHGTNNREIAKRAGVSTAAIYTHYPSKEALFTGLVEQHRALVAKWLRKTIAGLRDPLAKPDLTAFASAIRAKMRKDPEYFLLIFIDVVEFKNQHFRASFHDVPEWFRRALGPVLDNVRDQPGWCGQDPAFVLAAVYMYFVHYGLIEQHMGGRRHLGVSNEQAIKQVVELLCGGLWRMPPRAARGNGQRKPPSGSDRQKLLEEAMQSRIDFIRLLSGRMWSAPPEIPVGRSRAGEPATVPLLFLPEISPDRPDDTQLRIEAAALELFTTQGFHGTNIRDIAEKAGVSQGRWVWSRSPWPHEIAARCGSSSITSRTASAWSLSPALRMLCEHYSWATSRATSCSQDQPAAPSSPRRIAGSNAPTPRSPGSRAPAIRR
jgi:AcrR family transcriptional regulator